MNAIALLGGIKLFIDIIDGGPKAAVKGIVTSVIPGSDLITVANSVDYIFNLNGNYSSTIDLDKYPEYSASEFNFINQKELDFALDKYDFPTLAEKKFYELNKPNFRDRNFPTF